MLLCVLTTSMPLPAASCAMHILKCLCPCAPCCNSHLLSIRALAFHMCLQLQNDVFLPASVPQARSASPPHRLCPKTQQGHYMAGVFHAAPTQACCLSCHAVHSFTHEACGHRTSLLQVPAFAARPPTAELVHLQSTAPGNRLHLPFLQHNSATHGQRRVWRLNVLLAACGFG